MANLPYISPELLESYQKEISAQTSQATSKRKMASLKKFFGWAKTEGHLPENPIEAIAPLPQPPENVTPRKHLKISNIIKIGALVGMAVLVFLLVGRVKIPIPFRLAPAGEPTASLFPTASPTPSSVTVTPTATPAPSLREEVDPIFSKIYQDGVLTLEGTESAIKSIGGLLIEAASLVLKTENNTDGDIEIAPDGSGIAHFLFEGTGQNFLNAQAPNLTSGSLYYGIVANNSTGYNLLKLQSGSNPTTRFSVDALGNTYLGGNITIGNNLIIGGAIRFTNLGRLTSITGYYQNSGIFEIDQGGPDYVNITKSGATATADAVTIKLDETGQTASNYDTLVLSRVNGGAEAYALLIDEGNSLFDGNLMTNGQMELGRFSSNPGSIGQGSLIFNTTDLNTYVWNGTSWEDLTATAGSPSFADITSGTNTTAAMVVGTGASLDFSGSGTINASSLGGFTSAQYLRSDTSDSFTSGTLTTDPGTTLDVNGDLAIADTNIALDGASTTFTASGALTLNSNTTNALTLDSGTTGAVNIGTSANAKAITIGNTTTTTTVNLTKGATGNIVLTGFNCTSPTFTNGGALTTDASGNIACSDDDSGAGTTAWSSLTSPSADLSLNHTSTGQYATVMSWTVDGTDLTFDPWTFSLVNDPSSAFTQNFITIKNALTANGTDTNTETLLLLDNADTSASGSTVVDAAIKITNSGTLTNGITTALDASTAQIVNAVSVGPNTILGTTATIDFSEFDVSPTDGSITINDDANAGNITIEGTVLDINSLNFTDAGEITAGGTADLTLNPAGGQVILPTGDTINVGGLSGVTYNAFADGTDAPEEAVAIAADNDVYIGGDLEVDGTIYATIAASSVPWNGIIAPTGDLTLAHTTWNTTFNWDPGPDAAEANFTLSTQGEDTTGTGDQDQVLLALSQTDNTVDVDEAADALLTFANSDANDPVENAIRFDAGGAGTDFTYGINFDAADIGTAEIVLENAERIHNQTDGTITLEDDGGNDLALFVDQGTTGRLAVSDSLQVGGTSTVAYSRFGTTATDHSGAGNVDAASDVVVNDDLEVDGTLWLDGGVIHNSAGTLIESFTSTPTTTANQLTGSSWLVTNPSAGNLGWAALIVDQTKGTDGTTDVFAASASGSTVFRINRDGGTFIIAGGTPPSTLLTVGAGSGKIDVGTVDPVYNIGGTKYATYMAGMIGVKEETAGNVNTEEYIPGVGYRHLIDFKNQETGSDLWLFSKATNLRENLGKMVVLLTPSVNTKTWYSLDKENYTLSIYSLKPTSVSYRFTAPRFDYSLWTNYNYNPGAEGFKIDDEEIALNSSGEVTPDPSPTFADFSIEEGSSGYELKDKLGQAVEGFEAFADFIAANIKAGAVETKELLAENIVSPRVETALLSPLPDESNVAVQIGKTQEDGTSGFGELIIQDATGSSVASIDSQGNASFEGKVESESLEVATEATVAGTLYANDIKSTTLDDIQNLLREVEADQNLLAQASNWNTNTSTEAATIHQQLSVNDLFVTNTLAATTLSLSTSLTIGNDLIVQGNSINTLSAPLTIQSLAMAPIELMAGKVKIETNGDVAIAGNLYVAGKIESTGLNIKSSSEADESIAQIDASGSGTFKSVTTDDLVVASSQTSDVSSIVNGEITTNATVGTAVIPAGTSELTIRNPKITDYTLVYVTPTSSTSNHVLYVKSKSAGFFSVGFSEPLETNVSFNWWIVSITQ